MYQKWVIVSNELGLHARPAAIFVMEAKKYISEIQIHKDNDIIDGKSILAVLSSEIVQGTKLEISANGADEKEAVEALVAIIKSGLGE